MSENNRQSKVKKQAPKKQKSAIFELIYGFLCVLVTALFCVIPILLLEKSKAITFNLEHGFFFLTFILICAIGAGFFLFYRMTPGGPFIFVDKSALRSSAGYPFPPSERSARFLRKRKTATQYR